MNSRVSMSLWGLAAFMSAGVGAYAWVFVPSGGSPAPGVLANLFARPWLAVHAALAGAALILGPFQFLRVVRDRRVIHRTIGKIYVVSCLISGSAGFILAFGNTSGPIAGFGFGILAVIWVYATSQAWRMAQARRFDAHRRWMIRSFALTFGAVTLRIYMPLSQMMGIDDATAYQVIAWLAWVPNLILVEMFLLRQNLKSQLAE
ncbi:DUF2306 domain-containing protein [Phenylobacterium sp.]|uniref:DUF2306 domain-containing protein n=1 Tax=Phenylobacterium sp. TaxID=1871053 RepID=UPI0037C5D882